MLFFTNGFGYGTWIAHLPVFESRLRIADGALGLALFAAACATLVSIPLAGAAVARFGARLPAAIAAIAAHTLLVLPFAARSYIGFTAAAVVLAFAYSAMDVSMNAGAIVVERQRARPLMSSFHAVFSAGGLAGSVVAALAIAAHVPVWATGAVVGVVCCTLCACVVTRLPRDEARITEVATDTSRTGARAGYAAAAALGVLAFLGLVGEGAMADWSGIYLHTSLGLGAAASATGFGAFSVAMTAGRALGDRIVRRFGPVRTLALGAAGAAVALAVALTVHTAMAAFIGFACVGLGLANAVPVLFSASGRIPALPPGAGIATVTALGYVGFVVAPPAIGFVSDAFGIRLALTLVVASIASVAVFGPPALGRARPSA